MRNLSKLALIFWVIFFSVQALAFDLGQIEKELKTSGVAGWVHGAIEGREIFVFTVRNPENFFENWQFPLTSENAAIIKVLAGLNRHDKVLIQGHFIKNKAPQVHIDVAQIKVIERHDSQVVREPYQYQTPLSEVTSRTELTARVHIVEDNGKIMVIEYRDLVIPVFVRDPRDIAVAKTLYRGDKIHLNYQVRSNPKSPVHLMPVVNKDPKAPAAVTVLERLLPLHGQPLERSGSLVMFPKSPQVIFDVYALLAEDADGSTIQYTLVNFENPDLFKAIREKLGATWEANKASAVNGRNKMINRRLKVTAKGIGNMQVYNQANPQILINDINDLHVEVVP